MFFARSETKSQTSGPKGRRAYVVGDVHGRDDLLDELLERIDRDLVERPVRRALVVFVGDLIDRGPGSARVIETLRTFDRPNVDAVFLLGNHEEVLLRILDGDHTLIDKWRSFGGRECMASYGLDPVEFVTMSDSDALAAVRQAVPESHAAFLRSFADTVRFGDYLIVHAGIRPGVAVEEQKQSDLRWIRDGFLHSDSDHGFVVVHGHTIVDEAEEYANRIAIDTGAYRSNRLTALVIEGQDRRYLVADGTLAVNNVHSGATIAPD